MEKQEKDHQEVKPLVTDFQVKGFYQPVSDQMNVWSGYFIDHETLTWVDLITPHGFHAPSHVSISLSQEYLNELAALLKTLKTADAKISIDSSDNVALTLVKNDSLLYRSDPYHEGGSSIDTLVQEIDRMIYTLVNDQPQSQWKLLTKEEWERYNEFFVGHFP